MKGGLNYIKFGIYYRPINTNDFWFELYICLQAFMAYKQIMKRKAGWTWANVNGQPQRRGKQPLSCHTP